MMQQPAPGSRRDINMDIVLDVLGRKPRGYPGSYGGLADACDLTVQQTQRACDDLRYFYPDIVIGIPAPRNGYKVVLGWQISTQLGEGNQGRHLATRMERTARRWMDCAVDPKCDPIEAEQFEHQARSLKRKAKEIREFAESLG